MQMQLLQYVHISHDSNIVLYKTLSQHLQLNQVKIMWIGHSRAFIWLQLFGY